MSKYYSPGASINDDYAYICDMCEVDDGRPTLVWKKRDFALCYKCIENLANNFLDLEYLPIIGGYKRKFISEDLRNRIFERDNYKCVLCGSEKNLCLDHINPFSGGGETKESNLQTLCKSCNSKKGNKIV